MKSIVYILFATLLFSSCKEVIVEDPKANNGTETIEDWLPGSWSLKAISQENGVIKINGFQTGSFTAVGENVQGTIVFNENPKTFSTTASYTSKMTVTIANQTSTQSIPINGTDNGSWDIDDNDDILITGSNNTEQLYEVIEASSSKIIVKFKLLISETANGFTTETTADVIATYEK